MSLSPPPNDVSSGCAENMCTFSTSLKNSLPETVISIHANCVFPHVLLVRVGDKSHSACTTCSLGYGCDAHTLLLLLLLLLGKSVTSVHTTLHIFCGSVVIRRKLFNISLSFTSVCHCLYCFYRQNSL